MRNSTVEPSKTRVVLDAATAADLMDSNPVSVAADATLAEAATFLSDSGFSAAPVIDEAGRPVGVLSLTDLIVHDRVDRVRGNALYRANAELGAPTIVQTDVVDGDSARVGDVMTPAVFSVPPDMPAPGVIEAMLAENVHRLFVVGDDGVLVGTISTIDILRHLQVH